MKIKKEKLRRVIITLLCLSPILFLLGINMAENNYCAKYINATHYGFVWMEETNDIYTCWEKGSTYSKVEMGINQEDKSWWWSIAS